MEKLKDPYGSPPGRPARYALYLSRHGDDDTQTMVVTFGAPYAARKFLDVLLKDDGIVWEGCGTPTCDSDACTIRSETGIVVSTRWWPERMRKCVEHEYSLPEMTWTLDPQHVKWAKQFRNGPDFPRTLEEAGVDPTRKKTRSASGPSVGAPAGYVHVSDVALAMSIDSKQARVALRKLYPEGKPAYGWYFDPAKLDDVKAKIKEVLK